MFAHGAVFENVGQWKRPWYFPRHDEDIDAAVLRECQAAREGAAVMDASTLADRHPGTGCRRVPQSAVYDAFDTLKIAPAATA